MSIKGLYHSKMSWLLAVNLTLGFCAQSAFSMEEAKENSASREQEDEITFDEVFKRTPQEIADAIFQADLELFLALDPMEIANIAKIKYDGGTPDAKVQQFLNRIDALSQLVKDSLDRADDKKAAVMKWEEVSKALLVHGDIFGFICVSSGLTITKLWEKFGTKEDFEDDWLNYGFYVQEKKRRLQHGIIPAIIHEHTLLYSCLDGIDASLPAHATLQTIDHHRASPISAFMYDLSRMQNGLREFAVAMASEGDRRLINFFKSLTKQ